MDTMELKNRRSERGFTLVELAIVMIIIGLLIGGILKGQELIANAQVGATVAQTKAIDAAATTFRDKYDAMAGDMLNPGGRLQNCTAAPCTTPGTGNGRLDANIPSAAPTGENQRFFIHLAAADLLTGVSIDGVSPNGAGTWGGAYPQAKIAGGFQAAYFNGAAGLGQNPEPTAGHYLALVATPQTAPANTALTNLQAARIDRKLDDGSPTAGSVFANGGACDYDETSGAAVCDLYIRFQ